MRDYQAEEIYGSDWNAWSVDVKRALLDEPGSDPTLLEP